MKVRLKPDPTHVKNKVRLRPDPRTSRMTVRLAPGATHVEMGMPDQLRRGVRL